MLYDSPYRGELGRHYAIQVEGITLRDGNPHIQYSRKNGEEFGTMVYVGNRTMEELKQMFEVGNRYEIVTDRYFWVCTTKQEYHSRSWKRGTAIAS